MLRRLKKTLGSRSRLLSREKPPAAVPAFLDVTKVSTSCGVLLLEATIECEGLFRASGDSVVVKAIYAKFMDNDAVFSLIEFVDRPLELAYSLRQYLLKLEEPICTFELYEQFLVLAAHHQDEEKFVEGLVPLLRQLREQRITSLICIIRTLARLCRMVEREDLSSVDCAIALGAAVLRPREFGPAYVSNVKLQCQVMTAMINFYDSWKKVLGEAPNEGTVTIWTKTMSMRDSAFSQRVEEMLEDADSDDGTTNAEEETTADTNEIVSDDLDGVETQSGEVRGKVKRGSQCPLFHATDSRGVTFSVQNVLRRGKKLIIFFYPKAFSPACTIQNRTFRNKFSLFQYANVEVVGISCDPVKCHEQFVAELKLPFSMLSDPQGRLRRMFGVSQTLGLTNRTTFVVDTSGIVEHVYCSMIQPKEHVLQSLFIVSQLLEEEVVRLPPVLREPQWTRSSPALPPRRAM